MTLKGEGCAGQRNRECKGPVAGEVGSPCEWRGGAHHFSRAMVGDSGLERC